SESLFADVFAVADRYGLDPAAEGLPDVLALSRDGYQAQAKWSPFHGGLLRPAPHPTPPRTLALPGQRIPGGMEGRVIQEAFETPLPIRRGARPVIATDPH